MEKLNYIKGTYTTTIYNNSDNGYTVGILKVSESDLEEVETRVFFTGTFYDLKERNNYILYGNFIKHPKYGEQFNVSKYEIVIPTVRDELITFLSSDLFPIGEKTATKIVDLFKDETIDTILNNKDNLLLVPRLSAKKIEKIYNTLVEYQSSSQIVMDLTTLGFSSRQALSILNKYHNKTLEIIDKNIYEIDEKLNIPFLELDNIALNSGLEENDERRVRALILYLIEQITFNNGDTFVYFEELFGEIRKYIEYLTEEELEYNLFNLNKERKVIIIDGKYYLKKYYDAENYIVSRLCYLNDLDVRHLPKLEEEITKYEEKNDIKYDEIQKKAIIKSLNNNLTIITGGPGTGKTTIINAIVSLLQTVYKANELDIALLAPTGRAAKKLTETTGIYASTIHKFLGWDKESNTFSYNEKNPNKEKYVIVDETSMIDTILMDALLRGIKEDVKLILVGDYYQLPSVGQGQVLKDIIDSEVFDVVYLNHLYRQSEDSYIVNLAYEIKNKELTESFIMKKDDYNFIDCDKDSVIMGVVQIVKKALAKGYTDKDIQILAPMYKTINGIDNLNMILQDVFNPKSEKEELKVGEVTYRVGDKILQLVNDNDNNVYNGDMGYIVDIVSSSRSESKKNEIIINYDDNYVTYTSENFQNIKHGYAITVHKAQGGEYKMVIMPIVNSFKRMLYNKLIYTAVTRAKSSLVLIGEKEAFIYGVRNDYIDNRKTTLKELLINRYNN